MNLPAEWWDFKIWEPLLNVKRHGKNIFFCPGPTQHVGKSQLQASLLGNPPSAEPIQVGYC